MAETDENIAMKKNLVKFSTVGLKNENQLNSKENISYSEVESK